MKFSDINNTSFINASKVSTIMTDRKARIVLIVSAITVSAFLGISLIFITGGNAPFNDMTLVAIGGAGIAGFFALAYNFLFVRSFTPVPVEVEEFKIQ